MNQRNVAFFLLVVFSCTTWAQSAAGQRLSSTPTITLKSGWELQSSCKVDVGGDVLSTPKFRSQGWYVTDVPTTVLAALVNNKVYPDPYFGMNLRSLPGVTYPIGTNFSNLPMQQDSPFLVPWWYRKQFVIPESFRGGTIWVQFEGINYGANIWLNGKELAKSDEVVGARRSYEFNVTATALPGTTNVLAVEVFSPLEDSLATTFVDWGPSPPDKDMGIFREVTIRPSGPVALRYPAVISKVNSPANDQAQLTVTALLHNATDRAVHGQLRGRIENIQFLRDVDLAPSESKDIVFEPDRFPQLNLAHPRLWWPAQMGTPNLYRLSLAFEVDGRVSDRAETQFGIREITSELNANKHRVFSINGKKIMIRGGGWAPDMMFRENSQRLEDEFRYVQDMGLNTIRLEGTLETEDFYDLADRKGVLIMAGWVCCSPWEHWPTWKPENFVIAEQSARDQIYQLRSHASLVMWLNGSDNPPPPDVEEMYLKVEKELLWPNPVVSSATAKTTSVTGESGVKMTGPYDYVAPGYWEQDSINTLATHKECNPGGCGGAYGFNTETSMGPAVPPIESIREMLPKDHLWPIDDWWNFHAGGGEFKTIHVFAEALNARYGPAESAEDFALKSQLMTYEGVRAMYEAYDRNKYVSTGVIQWMLNNSWPSMIWHLYDYYLRPGGGYFGAKKAMEPLHPLYGYDDQSIWVVSSRYEDVKGLKLRIKVLNLDMTEKFSLQTTVDAAADSTQKILTLPAIDGLSPTYFVVLRLEDAAGHSVGSNFYWLSSKPETLDWQGSNWWLTPTASYADFTGLAKLNKVKLNITSRTERKGEAAVTHVMLENPSQTLAFFVRLKVAKGAAGAEVLPVIWEDNYVSLLPGEKREITATYRAADLGAAKPTVEVTGWNVQ